MEGIGYFLRRTGLGNVLFMQAEVKDSPKVLLSLTLSMAGAWNSSLDQFSPLTDPRAGVS